MTQPRKDSMNSSEIETHHVWSRCVRGAFLMGVDPNTGKDYGYRRGWLESLIEYQASVFAVDIGGYNILQNHFHEVLRNRPDIAKTWSDEQVVVRWKMAWPKFEDGVWHCEPTDRAIEAVLLQAQQDEHLIDKIRANLSNLSWLQARIKQPFAWQVNRDEKKETRGHLWEQRYGNRRLDDDDETVTALLYTDLQQTRAGMVDRVEASDYSSIKRHFEAHAREAFKEVFDREATGTDGDLAELEHLEAMFANSFLAPICTGGPLLTRPERHVPANELVLLPAGYTFDSGPDRCPTEHDGSTSTSAVNRAAETCERSDGGEAHNAGLTSRSDARRPRGRPRRQDTYNALRRVRSTQRRRASRNAILDMPWEQYRDLLKQLEAQIITRRSSVARRGPIPTEIATTESTDGGVPPGMAHPRETPATWRGQVNAFKQWLQNAVDLPDHLAERVRSSRGDPPDEPTS